MANGSDDKDPLSRRKAFTSLNIDTFLAPVLKNLALIGYIPVKEMAILLMSISRFHSLWWR